MTNPFLKPADGNYLKFVQEQIEALEIDESIKLSVGDKGLVDLRMSLTVISRRLHWEIKTKKDKYDDLWVKRIK